MHLPDHEDWTKEKTFFTGSGLGEKVSKTFNLEGPPQQARISTTTGDGWGYWMVAINDTIAGRPKRSSRKRVRCDGLLAGLG